MAGMPRAVATCGTALGEEHFRTMRNFAKRIVLAYDADSAGQSAAASVYQWEKQHEVDVAVARLPKGTDPAELAQKDPAALRDAIANAVPFLQFRLERVLEAANLATAEGRARGAEAALAVLAEHPNDLVRDQYVLQVADRLRLEVSALRPKVAEAVRSGTRKLIDNEPPSENEPQQRAPLSPMPRPGLEALRLCVHAQPAIKERFVIHYFINEIQREIFEGISSGHAISDVIEKLSQQGEEEAAQVLSEIVVSELDRDYSEREVSAVIAQLLRAATTEELKNVERELREGTIAPDVAMATIRDVKIRIDLLGGAQAADAEQDLRAWLEERATS